jgi:hypothetical protein
VLFSCRVKPVQLALSVYGTRRAAAVSLDARTLRLVEGSRLPGPFQKVDWARREAVRSAAEALGRARDLAGARLHYFEGMRALFGAFYAAARAGGPAPIAAADARCAAETLERIFAACREGEERAG